MCHRTIFTSLAVCERCLMRDTHPTRLSILDGTVPMFSNRVLIFMLMLAAWSICMLAAALTDCTP